MRLGEQLFFTIRRLADYTSPEPVGVSPGLPRSREAAKPS